MPKVLLGRRHLRHKFLPGKFVFPGGRVEIADRQMPIAAPLHERDIARLMQRVRRPSAAKAAAFALAAVRETYEETGLMLGVRRASRPGHRRQNPARRLGGLCQGRRAARSRRHAFHRPRHHPAKRPLRFDSRFFAADISAVAHRAEGFVGPDAELVELVWLPITEARSLDMPGITAVVLEELQDRIAAGMSHDHPVPLYRMLHQRFVREIL